MTRTRLTERQRFARSGGLARARSQSPEARRELARLGGLASAARRGRTTKGPAPHLPTGLDVERARLVAGPDAANLNRWAHGWRLARPYYAAGDLDRLARRWSTLPDVVRAVVDRDPESLLHDHVRLYLAVLDACDDQRTTRPD